MKVHEREHGPRIIFMRKGEKDWQEQSEGHGTRELEEMGAGQGCA